LEEEEAAYGKEGRIDVSVSLVSTLTWETLPLGLLLPLTTPSEQQQLAATQEDQCTPSKGCG